MAKLNIDAQQALQELREVIAEVNNIKKASKNMSQATAETFSKLEGSVSKLRNKISDIGNKLNYLEAILKKSNGAINSNTSTINTNTSAKNKNANSTSNTSKEVNSNTKATNKNTQSKNKNSKASKQSSEANKTLGNSLKNIFKLFGVLTAVQFFKDLVKNVYETTKEFDGFAFALEKISGSFDNFKDSERFIASIVSDFGVELASTTNRWIKFLAAAKESGLALRDTENIFRSMTKAAGVLGLQTDELQGVYLALEQMLSKGKVTTEELRRQLGERLPGAMGIMAAAVGVTIPKLDEMLKKGEVLSAEVLPKFARALELAYDIENVERIETITAAQNRLTASWQTFIKNLTEGDSVIKNVFGGLLQLIQETIDGWDRILQTEDQGLQKRIIGETKQLEKALKETYSRQLGLQKGFFNEKERLEGIVRKNKRAVDRAISVEEKEAANESYNESIQVLQKFNDERTSMIKQHALDNIAVARYEYEEDLKLKENLAAKQLKIEELASKNYNKFAKDETPYFEKIFGDTEYFGIAIKSQEDFNKVLEQTNSNIVASTAKWYLYKKLIEESDVVVPPDDESTKKTQRRLRRLKDYYFEIMNEITKGFLERDKEIAANEKLNLGVRLDAIKRAATEEVTIRENLYKIAERDSQAKLDSELASIRQSVANGTLAAVKGLEFAKDIEDERTEYLRLEAIKLANDLVEIQTKYIKDVESLSIETLDKQDLDETADIYNVRVIAIKKEYELSAKTAKDKEKLEKDLAKVTIDSTNAMIDAKIKLIQAEIYMLSVLGGATDEYIADLLRQANALEASKLTEPPENISDWKGYFMDILDLAREFNDAFAELVDNLYQRQIENINAEIVATEKKYDRYIMLAENDVEQTKTLERDKQEAIERLEKKRLAVEQKQARARKAFAIADIAISTAQAIVSIWAQVPKYDYGISAGILTGVVAALGATQIAAVAAQPIPQYEKGLDNAKTDHIGMINDGDYQEYIERNNKILTTTKKDAVIPVKKGDTIYRNYDDMISRSSLFKIKNNRANSIIKTDGLKTVIESSINKGFKNATIKNNNNINVIQSRNNSGYRDKLNRWSK